MEFPCESLLIKFMIYFLGVQCESICEVGRYGTNCQNKCDCGENGSSCESQSGNYEKLYFLRKNKKKELNGGEGRTAASQVFCLKRYFDVFYLLAGRCVCQQGFTGPRCDRPCPKGFYGVGCKQACLPCTSG